MNKTTLRLLLSIGLAVFIYASCSKDKDFPDIPDLYLFNDSVPFSVEAVPSEGCDTLFFFRIKENDSIKLPFNPTDASLEFKAGDSIILEAHAKSGYTFINWVRNWKEVSTKPIYGFKLDSTDIDTLNHVIYHYEARFGLDYALQVIPSIDEVMPADLISEMKDYLHFGDTPPQLDTCFYIKDSILIARFVHNQDIDPTSTFSFTEGQWIHYRQHNFRWKGQHRCVADQYFYTRLVGDSVQFLPGVYYRIFEKATVTDSIFIMGDGDKFTAYFHQEVERAMEPDEQFSSFITDYDLVRRESVIVSGQITSQGIVDFHYGVRIEGYNKPSSHIGADGGSPNVHDIILYECSSLCPFDPPYYQDNH